MVKDLIKRMSRFLSDQGDFILKGGVWDLGRPDVRRIVGKNILAVYLWKKKAESQLNLA